jgi:hypothetical protein
MTISPDVSKAVIDAYYARAMSSPDAARRRAQAAYGIASALVAAVLAAGLLGNLDERAEIVQITALVALLTWIVTAGLFLHTVSSPSLDLPTVSQQDEEAFVKAALDRVRAERTVINRWLKRAQIASCVAAAATLAAFALAVEGSPTEPAKPVIITLTGPGSVALASVCDKPSRRLTGSMAVGNLQNALVEVKLDAGVCAPQPVLVAIPRAAVLAVALQSESG